MKRWFLIHTHARGELKALAHLRHQGFSVYLPRYLAQRYHERRRDWVAKPLFPRYLFTQVDLGRDRWRAVYSTVGVRTLNSAEDRPLPVPTGIIEEIRSREDDRGYVVLGGGCTFRRGDRSSLHPRYCYARLNSEGLVEEMSEKRPISRNAVAGYFWWREADDFVDCASHVTRTQNDVNGQYYICPTLNEMIMLGKQVGVFEIESAAYHPLKTTAQSRGFEHGALV